MVNALHSRCSTRVAEQAELPPSMRSWRHSVMCGTSMSEPSALPSQLARSGKEGVSVKGRELMFCTCRSKTYAEERHRLAMQLETQGGRLPAKVRTSDTAHDDRFPTMCSSKIHPACTPIGFSALEGSHSMAARRGASDTAIPGAAQGHSSEAAPATMR